MLNKTLLIGHLGGDPVTRFMPDGTATATVSIATSEKWKSKDGQTNEHTEWHRLTFFGRRAEIVAQYLRKGSKIYAEGRLRTRKWEKDGVTHYTTEIHVDVMKMLDGKPSDGSSPTATPPRASNSISASYPARQEQYEGGFDDDIPF